MPEEEEGYVKGLTAEEIMNLPDIPDDEDDETKDMTIGNSCGICFLLFFSKFHLTTCEI